MSIELTVQDNLQRVQELIELSAQKSSRNPREIRLVVVTKGQSIEVTRAAITAGAHILGENYAEEAVKKIEAIGASPANWHMIGHIQSRKARLVAEYFDLAHSLDSLKLAGRLDRFSSELERKLPVLLEVNVSGEESKYGWPAWDKHSWQNLLPEIERLLEFNHIEVRGLMTMPPFPDVPEESRLFFVRLARLRDYLASRFPRIDWRELSMGTSLDYQVAIEEGATLVRIGTAILGPRLP